MRSVAPTVAGLMRCRQPRDSEVGPIRAVLDTMGKASHVMLVVFDGFGMATAERFEDLHPNLDLIMKRNFRRLRAVRPTKTPVNFATMATGASQAVHGIGQKTDPLGVETIFHTLAEANLTSCVAGRQSGSPAHLFPQFATYAAIAESNTDEEVLKLVVDCLREKAPSFTMIQFLDIDNAGHRSGPFGEDSGRAVAETDRRLGHLMDAAAQSEGGMIVLADHGQHEVEVKQDGAVVKKGKHDGSRKEDYIVPLAWCGADQLVDVVEKGQLGRGIRSV
jgi:hypothetical protein